MPFALDNINWFDFAMTMVALLICLTIHEFAHAYPAYRAGDDTAKLAGRVSLNPIDHLHPVGTIMMVLSSLSGFGIGWGKPVPVNPYRLRRPRWDNLMVSLWGPLSNLLTALVTGTIIRFAGPAMANSSSVVAANTFVLLDAITMVSIGLAMFNLIPISPLDGSHIISSLLPYEQARAYDMFMGRYGMFVFLALIFVGGDILGRVLGPPSIFLWKLFTGL